MSLFKAQPALIIGTLMTILAGASQVFDQLAGQPLSVWRVVSTAAPFIAGVIIRLHVVPAAAVTDAIVRARTSAVAVAELADRVQVAVNELPADARKP